MDQGETSFCHKPLHFACGNAKSQGFSGHAAITAHPLDFAMQAGVCQKRSIHIIEDNAATRSRLAGYECQRAVDRSQVEVVGHPLPDEDCLQSRVVAAFDQPLVEGLNSKIDSNVRNPIWYLVKDPAKDRQLVLLRRRVVDFEGTHLASQRIEPVGA